MTMRNAIRFLVTLLLLGTSAAAPAITGVHPTGVNVNTSGVTSVFLTFQGLEPDEVPVRAYWCGEVTVPANVVVNFDPCVPGTLLGNLPAATNFGRPSSAGGASVFSDIMTIPASVARRAYQQARAGEPSAFFYIREFRNTTTNVSSFVAVTCRLAGGGARVPLALTMVELNFITEGEAREIVPVLAAGELAPPVQAKLAYNGTGTLRGRWEVVMPGEEVPDLEDLLPEPSLPIELRGTQRRYTILSRFDVFLPPTGQVVIPGPELERIPTESAGPYLLLLRIETSADKEGDSETGAGTVQSGGLAGFPMPVLRYYVGSRTDVEAAAHSRAARLITTRPLADGLAAVGAPLVFSWLPLDVAALYRIEFRPAEGVPRRAFVPADEAMYRAPPWLAAEPGELHWRVVALDEGGRMLQVSDWRMLSVVP